MKTKNYYDKLTVSYEEFPEEDIKVLTVAKGDEAVFMCHGDEATDLYLKLRGESGTKFRRVKFITRDGNTFFGDPYEVSRNVLTLFDNSSHGNLQERGELTKAMWKHGYSISQIGRWWTEEV